jgi:hypothetical protein
LKRAPPISIENIMPRIAYIHKQFRSDSLARINQANEIVDEYMAAGR